MQWWLQIGGEPRQGKRQGQAAKNGLTRYLFRECHGCEDRTKAKTQEIKGEPGPGSRRINDIDGNPKPDQYGRRWYGLGRGSAHPFGCQAFLRRPLFEPVSFRVCVVMEFLGQWTTSARHTIRHQVAHGRSSHSHSYSPSSRDTRSFSHVIGANRSSIRHGKARRRSANTSRAVHCQTSLRCGGDKASMAVLPVLGDARP